MTGTAERPESGPKPIVIHRDRTFEYGGEKYRIVQGSDYPARDGSMSIELFVRAYDDGKGDDWETVAESFAYVEEVRDFLRHAQEQGWETLIPNDRVEEVARRRVVTQDSPMTVPPTIVVVIGSYAWSSAQTVNSIINEWWTKHGRPPVRMVTSGCPHGAEDVARQWARLNDWELMVLRDEELPMLEGAFFFAFIRDQSDGAEEALGYLERRGIPVEIHRETTWRDPSPWAAR